MIVAIYIPIKNRETWNRIIAGFKEEKKKRGKRYGIGKYICENWQVEKA